MTQIGPVQLVAIGFNPEAEFEGKIMAELANLERQQIPGGGARCHRRRAARLRVRGRRRRAAGRPAGGGEPCIRAVGEGGRGHGGFA